MHAAQQHRLSSKRAVLFRPIPGDKTGRIFHWLQTKHGAVLGWVGPTWRNWQRQVYRLRGFNWIRSSGSGRGIGEDERAGILVWLPATDRGFGWYTSLSDQPRAIIPSTVTTGSCLARLNSYAIPSFFGLVGVLRSPMQSHGHPEKNLTCFLG